MNGAQFDPLPAGVEPLVREALGEQVIPDPGLTRLEAEALQVIHPNAEVRKLQDAGREKLRAAAIAAGGCKRCGGTRQVLVGGEAMGWHVPCPDCVPGAERGRQ